ncbi:MAG: hypothetical protein U1F09_11520, partial [Steroidobacteraceae bacterium]
PGASASCMDSSPRTCSSATRARKPERPAVAAVAVCAALAAACGHAQPPGNTDGSTPAGTAGAPSPADASAPRPESGSPALPSGTDARCVAADEGSLEARLDGDMKAEIDWSPPIPQCRGGPRPGGDGVRLIYRGDIPGQGPLLVLIGIGPLAAGADATQVPVNLTLVREGTGLFYATRGDDKCAADDVRQVPTGDGNYRLTVRGYCVQPARSLDGTGSVLMSRFDATALVSWR